MSDREGIEPSIYKREKKDAWHFPGTEEQRTEEQARADREAKKRFADEVATENAMMVNSLFASCFGWNK